jgi:hypothetical protein
VHVAAWALGPAGWRIVLAFIQPHPSLGLIPRPWLSTVTVAVAETNPTLGILLYPIISNIAQSCLLRAFPIQNVHGSARDVPAPSQRVVHEVPGLKMG